MLKFAAPEARSAHCARLALARGARSVAPGFRTTAPPQSEEIIGRWNKLQAGAGRHLVGAHSARSVAGHGDVCQVELGARHLQRGSHARDPAPCQQLPKAARHPAPDHACAVQMHLPRSTAFSRVPQMAASLLLYFHHLHASWKLLISSSIQQTGLT